MLKGLAAWVLNNYLGQYVENLNTDQLSIGLLQGEVELEGLPLKKDALDAFDLPVVVRSGFIGKVRLQIPVTGLRSQPWIMSIEQLYLVAGPLSVTEYDKEKEDQISLERKLSKLDAMEAKWRTEHEAKKEVSYYASSYSSWVSYGTSFMSNILENMQLKIKDVHIRFEDDTTDMGHPFAWGITIESLEVQSSNKNWEPQYMQQENVDCVRKLADLQKLSIYWDSNAKIIGGLPLSEIVDEMFDLLYHGSDSPTAPSHVRHEYILEPVSAQARLQRNSSSHPLTSPLCPRFVCDLLLDTLPVALTESQYDSVVTWLYEFDRLDRAQRYRKWRPNCPVGGHAREWWQFAAQPRVEEIRRRRAALNWPSVLQRARDNVLYVEAYVEHLLNPVTCPATLRSHKDKVEREVPFEELRILRDIATEKVLTLEETTVPAKCETDSGTGVLQSWFPLWTGWWYPAAACTTTTPTTTAVVVADSGIAASTSEADLTVLDDAGQILEKKFRDVLRNSEQTDTLFRRDAAFAKINFSLKRGVFSLNGRRDLPSAARAGSPDEEELRRTLFELEIADVQIGLELRPRIRSTIFEITLGALYLRDKVMEGSPFSVLVSPQRKEEMLLPASSASAASYLGKLKGFTWGSSTTTPAVASAKSKEEPLFQLTYETKPFRSTADRRLHVKSQPLDIVYNPAALRRIADFFSSPHRRLSTSGLYPCSSDSEFESTASSHYEKLKRQTRQELQKNWENIVGGEQAQPFSQRWDVQLDVSAPQIVFPDNFFDANTTIVVLDFGRLQFATASSKVQERKQDVVPDSDDEDDFKTPCSSPPGEYDVSPPPDDRTRYRPVLTVVSEDLAHCDITELSLRERMYDRYSLELSDLQVLVCKAKNNWKYAYFQGTSTMHVLDRFSISLQLERRIVFTSDPQWPTVMLSGTLPKLVVHVNEQKMGALATIWSLFESGASGQLVVTPVDDERTSPFPQECPFPHGGGHSSDRSGDNTPSVASSPEVNPDARMLVMQFDVGRMCLDLQSRGRSIAELQITGIKSCFTRRLRDSSVGLTVHGLLLVDALQTFGPDFELLVASHRNISIDSVSGSLRDSEPNSPTSPASPTASYASCAPTSPVAINAALKSLQVGDIRRSDKGATSQLFATSPPHWLLPPPIIGRRDEEALIVVQITLAGQPSTPTADTESNARVQSASIRFNSLDIIANQETIVELIGFVRKLLPTRPSEPAAKLASPVDGDDPTTDEPSEADADATSPPQVLLTFNFHRLNVLLLKSVQGDGGKSVARKVATATMTEACIRATLGGAGGEATEIEGSLGGLQVQDLVTEGSRHPRILSVGHDPISEGRDHYTSLVDRLQADLYKKSWDIGEPEKSRDNEAFCFTIGHSFLVVDGNGQTSDDGCRTITMTLRMASVCYIHSPRFLSDLASCASEFRQYMTDLGTSLKVAATEVAMGLVRRGDLLASAFYGVSGGGGGGGGGTATATATAADGYGTKSRAPSGGYRTAASTVPPSPVREQSANNSSCRNPTEVRLNILLESPVIVVPESPSSSHVLVAHLGRITVRNSRQKEVGEVGFTQQGAMTINSDHAERVSVEIREMNLYSLDVEDGAHARPQDVYTDTRRGFPILHDTVVMLTVDRLLDCHVIKPVAPDSAQTTFTLDEDLNCAETYPRQSCDILNLRGRVITPLKLSLSKARYEQILRTIDSLTAADSASLPTADDDNDEVDAPSEEKSDDRSWRARFHRRGYGRTNSFDSVGSSYGSLAIKGLFELPVFTVELFGDLGEKGRDLVSLSFQDFLVDYEKQDGFTSNIQVTLRSVLMEDLLEEPQSRHRYLMTSSAGPTSDGEEEVTPWRSRFLSTSCPDISTPAVYLSSQQSLPDKLNTESVFLNLHRLREKRMFGGTGRHRPRQTIRQPSSHSLLGGECPCTPPPSPLGDHDDGGAHDIGDEDALVHLKILLVDPRCQDFVSRYNSTQQFVDVNFNCLDTIVSLHSWVVVLDFFGISGGGGNGNGEQVPPTPDLTRSDSANAGTHRPRGADRSTPAGSGNGSSFLSALRPATEMEIQVRRLSLVLNRREYELAKISVSNLVARVSNESNGDCTVEGKLGRLAVTDLTQHGRLYSERFTMSGYELLNFRFFRYGEAGRDQHPFDASIKLEMSSVYYVHTNRFFAELLTFFQQFNLLQGIVERFRAAAAEQERAAGGHCDGDGGAAGEQLPSRWRLQLDVRVGSPVVVVPVSPWSHEVLVADLGRLRLSNKFVPAASADASCAVPCLLDVMDVHLRDIDLFSAVRVDRKSTREGRRSADDPNAELRFSTFVVRKRGCALLTEKCMFDLQLERNLDSGSGEHAVADLSVRGALSTVHCRIDLDQYKLIRGILQHNLGEPLDDLDQTDVVYHQASTTTQPSFPIHRSVSSNVWTRLSFDVKLHNVVVEFFLRHASGDGVTPEKAAMPLARVNFIKSQLTYESASDQSSSVDLVSQEILISDTRYDDRMPGARRPNIFTNILQPTARAGAADSQHSDLLQAELHYRFTRNQSGLTILLNNMQVIAIFDWWQAVLRFVTTPTEDPPPTADEIDPAQAQSSVARSVLASRYAISVSAGIATKRGSFTDNTEPPFELKINVTETGVVVVADAAAWDTDALTLKSTAVVRWRPDSRDRPLSCSLQRLEIFSCVLGLEEDTALSIVDPVTINMEVTAHDVGSVRGLLDVADVEVAHKLEVTANDLRVRLSYHDVQLFTRILDSLPEQSGFFRNHLDAVRLHVPASGGPVEALSAMGFRHDDCRRALEANDGRLNDAAIWLTQHASPSTASAHDDQDGHRNKLAAVPVTTVRLHEASLHVNLISLCLIDDCRDADVPLAELTLSRVDLRQALFGVNRVGGATFQLSGDYYNRALSGWEPFLEPWNATVEWETARLISDERATKLLVKVEGDKDDVLDLNVTASLVQLYRSVQKSWTEDYYRETDRGADQKGQEIAQQEECGQRQPPFRRRSPFVPFALSNQTGCKLKFATVTVEPDQMVRVDHQQGVGGAPVEPDRWTDAGVDVTKPFTFEGRLKMRHRDTHRVRIHQLIVRVEGYHQVAPVSVDKVGVFFRHARPLSRPLTAGHAEPPEVRIVFAVTLEGSARKLVTVRSALLLDNRLGSTLEVRLESSALQQFGAVGLYYLSPGQQIPVPLPYVSAHIFARPVDGDAPSVLFCSSPVQWQHVTRPSDTHEAMYWCSPMSTRPNVRHYRFCASVHHQDYPTEIAAPGITAASSTRSVSQACAQPGHVIAFLPPVVLVNLLPCDLCYEVRPGGDVRGVARPGREVALHLIDQSETFEIRAKFDNFALVNDLVVPSGTSGFAAPLRAVDQHSRELMLRARVTGRSGGCAIRIQISAPFWIVNRTGLPLVFRQDGASAEAAGQSGEHEVARSVAPLLFSFSADTDGPALLAVRAGRSLVPSGEPQWCSPFPLRPGTRPKRLCVLSRNNRPDSIYSLGVDVRAGRGRYADVNVVTLEPRFHLNNHSSHHLEFTQRFALGTGRLDEVRLTAKSRSLLPFHWPRPDLDQLLCVRVAEPGGRWSSWSGGFSIDRVQSFHLNIRDADNRPFFLRVEVLLQGATYFVVLSDAASLPPPFRIDNLSEVPIVCHQTETTSESLRLTVRPMASLPYAWDEPTLQQWITCTAPGGCRAKYNLNVLGDNRDNLSYENFIYIAFTETFSRREVTDSAGFARRRLPDDVGSRQLVLDVPDGGKHVFLARKETGKRSQLWRMTSTGLIQHEGSSPPRSRNGRVDSEGKSSTAGAPLPSGFVLDTFGKAPLPTEHSPLVLKEQDPRRSLTQTWEFTEDGRLRCKFHGLFVQCADGFEGLVSGSHAVLGQSQPVIYSTTARGIPTEQAVGRQKLWPGSGLLGVQVVADGPTRVLRILDVHQRAQQLAVTPENETRKLSVGKRSSLEETVPSRLVPENRTPWHLELQVWLPRGLGLSLVNAQREELTYLRLTDVKLGYCHTPSERSVDGSVRDVQVDNQLPDSECPVLLFVSPASRSDMQQSMPAIRFVVKHVATHHTNVDLFKPFMLEVKNLTLPVDERLLWKLAQFFGIGAEEERLGGLHETPESQRFSQVAEAALAKRYYFSLLKLSLNKVRLSMFTDSQLPPDLAAIKSQMGLTLIRFEDAQVELDPFERTHPFETSGFLVDSVVLHYKEELKKQAAKILVAFDFLGNPVGLVNDLSEGLSEFKEGNVGGLLKNVTHGLSNSAAKVTGTLSDGLGVVSMDNRHELTRKKIRTEHGGSSSDQLVAGFKGLGFGLLSGMTSIVTQTYVGASSEGLPGFFTGFGKGLVGTFTKPAAGVLDLAASAASAVRDTSRGKNHYFPSQVRKRRLCVGPGGLLPKYSSEQSRGQELLYVLNNKDYSEMFIALEVLNYSTDGLRALVSSRSVYFLSQDTSASTSSPKCATILEVHFRDLYHCKIAKQMGDFKVTYYLELTTRAPNSTASNSIGETKYNRPRVLCDTEEIALKVTQQINYAKGIYEELVHTLGVTNFDNAIE